MKADRIAATLRGREEWCKVNGNLFADNLEAQGRPRPASFKLRLENLESIDGTAILSVIDDDNRARFCVSF